MASLLAISTQAQAQSDNSQATTYTLDELFELFKNETDPSKREEYRVLMTNAS